MFKTHLKAVFGIFLVSAALSCISFLMAYMSMPEDLFTFDKIVNDSFDFALFSLVMVFSVMTFTYTLVSIIEHINKSE